MNSGLCQCTKGMNGSPCKHQYVLWVNKLSDSLNFLPRFSPEQKKKCFDLAICCSMDVGKYEGIHDLIVNKNQVTNIEPTEYLVDFNALPGTSKETTILRRNKNIKLEEAWAAIDKASSILKQRLTSEYQQL